MPTTTGMSTWSPPMWEHPTAMAAIPKRWGKRTLPGASRPRCSRRSQPPGRGELPPGDSINEGDFMGWWPSLERGCQARARSGKLAFVIALEDVRVDVGGAPEVEGLAVQSTSQRLAVLGGGRGLFDALAGVRAPA